jgi:hypothetical protein
MNEKTLAEIRDELKGVRAGLDRVAYALEQLVSSGSVVMIQEKNPKEEQG